jgi:hypothetical protein
MLPESVLLWENGVFSKTKTVEFLGILLSQVEMVGKRNKFIHYILLGTFELHKGGSTRRSKKVKDDYYKRVTKATSI